MIQAVYKGIEIEMEMHQQAHDYWKCDYTLIKHPERTETLHHGDKGFPTMELAWISTTPIHLRSGALFGVRF